MFKCTTNQRDLNLSNNNIPLANAKKSDNNTQCLNWSLEMGFSIYVLMVGGLNCHDVLNVSMPISIKSLKNVHNFNPLITVFRMYPREMC